MLEFSLQLILAHLAGDFLLQPQKWVTNKNLHGYKSKFLYYHIAAHTLLLTPFLFINFSYYLTALLLIISTHYFIDITKIALSKKYPAQDTFWFFGDQLMHLCVIAIVVHLYYPYIINLNALTSRYILTLAIAAIIIFNVSPIIIRQLVAKWANVISSNINNDSLIDAGKYIGIIERLLIILFICIDFFEGIGYLLAAKSIFRFGDLTKSKEKKLTEYILLGTLISFALAIIIGLGLKYILQKI